MAQLATPRSELPLTPFATRTYIDVLQLTYPVILLFFFLIAFCAYTIIISNRNSKQRVILYGPGGKPLPGRRSKKSKPDIEDFPHGQKLAFEWLSLFVCGSFIANAANVILHALYDRKTGWWCGQPAVVYIVGSFFVYSLLAISIFDQKPSPTTAHLGSWVLAVALEVVLLGGYLQEDSSGRRIDKWHQIELAIDAVRLVILLGLVGLYGLFATAFSRRTSVSADTTGESSPLLPDDGATFHTGSHGAVPSYGGTDAPVQSATEDTDEPGWVRPQKAPRRTWWEYLKSYSVFFPYLWPSKERKLQLLFLACFTIVIVQRGTNVLVPLQVGKVIDDLSGENGPVKMPWGGICLYILFRLLQGSNGLLNALRSWMWIPINQYSYRELSVASFEHVHGLSLDFHTGKKTGEVISALGKGNSINTFLEQVTFQFLPMIVDLVVAIGYFLFEFDAYFALIVTIVTFWYIYLTIRLAQWRVDLRREMTNANREQDAIMNDSMQGYESVKYFNAEGFEFNRYRGAVVRYQKAEYRALYTLSLMNVTQNLVFTLGVMMCCFLAAYQVTTDRLKVGKFVSLLTYMSQLQQPLNFFGTFYRSMQAAMINSERMLELFKEKPTVVDKPGAQPLPICEGDIRFNDVEFSYDQRKPALRGFHFHARPGTTTAFVGESGGGKSTVFRLLFRFYQPQGGTIEVDGQNIEGITIDSLRRHIGVVPQDTVLFNETIMYNLKYANQDATDEEVYEACKAASIHDKILTFPDGYGTKVGERGLRLSGGEKQRVAIARTILKGPRIILLDEATAALDTDTEQNIQEALDTLGNGRTMLVIAHRLSTIARADQILVLHDGKVLEHGTHQQLFDMRGRYYQMWRKQAKAQKAEDESRKLQDKADRLRRESKDMAVSTDEGSSTGSTPFTSEGEEEKAKKPSTTSASGRRSRAKSEGRT